MNPLEQLQATGVSIWLDTLSRDLRESGGFERLRQQSAVTGATSNPTIFAMAIVGSDSYDRQLAALLDAGVIDPREQFLELALEDVRRAAGELEDEGVDAFHDSYRELLASIERRADALGGDRRGVEANVPSHR